jgi:predicted enzyme related to lactoylglutathione lyase
MRRYRSTIMALTLLFTGACGAAGQGPAPVAPKADAPAAAHTGLRIQLTTVYVDDQERALRFYTQVLGFAKKDDVENGGYRWLTVTAPDDPDGGVLQLALDNDPAGKAFQEARFAQSQPAIMFFTDDIDRDYARIKAQGAEFTMPPTPVTGSTIAMLDDTCGNLIQITELVHP